MIVRKEMARFCFVSRITFLIEIVISESKYILPLSQKKLAFEVSNSPSWKSANEIVPYDTYINFEENLGEILFA